MNRAALQQLSNQELVERVLSLQEKNAELQQSKQFLIAVQQGELDPELTDLGPSNQKQLVENYRDVMALLQARQHDLQNQLRRTALLMQLAIELRENLDFNTIMERVLRVISSNLDVKSISILLVGPDGTIERASSLRNGSVQQMPLALARAVMGRGLAGWVLRHGRSVVLADVSRDKRWIQYAQWQQTGSVIVLPIRQAHCNLGVLTVHHSEPNHFSNEDLLLMEGVVSLASVALGSAQRYLEESYRREQALALLDMSQFLTVERAYEELATMLQRKSTTVFGVDYGLLYLPIAEGADLKPIAAPLELTQENKKAFRHATAAAKQAWDAKKIVNDTIHAEEVDLTCVALPLIHSSHAIGAIVLVRLTKGTVFFSANTWSLLTVFTNLIAANCANSQLVSKQKDYLEKLEALIEERTRQLQNSRDTIRVVFDHLPEGLVLLDPQEVLLAANHAFCYSVIGRHPRTIVGRSLATLWEELEQRAEMHIELLPPPPTSTRRLNNTEAGKRSLRILCTDATGQQKWYEVVRTPIIKDAGEVEQYVERWRDVTQQEELQRRLLMHEQLITLGRMTGSVIHEVGGPLQSALGCLKRCGEDLALTEKSREDLTLAGAELEHMGRTLESLRYLQNPTQADWECVNLNLLLQQVQQFTSRQFARYHIDLQIEPDHNLPKIYGQIDALRQVFLNILLNAQDSMPKGGPIELTTSWRAESRRCQITIRDTGVGLNSRQLTHIFDPFSSEKESGPGLGLYLTKQIVEQHAGRISVHSRLDQGTVVEIMLPWNEKCDESSENSAG
jgi:PAS domain S-box-containing protein